MSKVVHEPFPILVSYAYLRSICDRHIKWLFERDDLHVLLDSGAFTAFSTGEPIDVQEYIEFLQKWDGVVRHYMALDVINEVKGTRRNLRVMLEAGLSPIPVFVTGEQEPWINELYKHKDIVAIPLSVPVSKSMAVRRKFLQMRMKWAAGRKVHWFGFTRQKSIQAWKPFSCDSSSWLSSVRYGIMNIYLGGGKWTRATAQSCKQNPKICLAVQRRIEELGFDPNLCLDDTYWHRNVSNGVPTSYDLPLQVTIHSMVQYVRDIRQRFGTWLHLSARPGEATNGGDGGDLYWVYCHLRGDDVSLATEVHTSWDLYEIEEGNGDARTKSRRVAIGGARLDRAVVSPLKSRNVSGRAVGRLRADAQKRTRFRQRNLLEAGDTDGDS